jgi:hypothetical protein
VPIAPVRKRGTLRGMSDAYDEVWALKVGGTISWQEFEASVAAARDRGCEPYEIRLHDGGTQDKPRLSIVVRFEAP